MGKNLPMDGVPGDGLPDAGGALERFPRPFRRPSRLPRLRWRIALAFLAPALFVANLASAAAPVFQAAGTIQNSTGIVTVPWPAHQANDIGLLILETANQAMTITSPAGWVQVADSPQGTGTAGNAAATRITVFWKRAVSSSEASVVTSDPGNHIHAQIVTFRGVITSGNPWDVTAGDVASTASTAVTIPGNTTTTADCLVVAIVSNATDTNTSQTSGWTNANLTSVTERVDSNVSTGNGGGYGVATGVRAVAGNYGATTATLLTSSMQGRMSIALASIVPVARLDHFAVTTPGTQTAGTAFAITTITAQDVNNNTVTGYTGTVDLTETGGGAGGTVVPGQSSAFTAGVLSGQSVTLTKSGAGVTITATDHGGSKTGASGGFTVNPGAATKIRVETASNGSGAVVPAQNVTAGSSITVYSISRDANDNFVANAAADSWSLTGITGGVVAGDLVAAGDSKSATFTGHLVGTAALHAAKSGLVSTDSGTVTVIVGAPFKLGFGTQPTNTQGGSAISPAITVRILDVQNNLTTSTASVTAAILTNPGGGILSGTLTRAAVAGTATFNDLAIDKAGTAYTLSAASAGLVSAVSAAFNIVGTARWIDNALGSDANTGAQAAPFKTISKGVSVLASSGTLFIRVGNSQSGTPYTANTVVAASASGTAAFPTRVLGVATGSTLPLVTGADPDNDAGFDIKGNEVTVDGFEIHNTQVGVYSEASNTGAEISHNYVISGHFGYGIILDGTSGAWVHDNRVEHVSGGASFFGIWDYAGNGNLIELNKVKGHGSDGIVSHYSTGLVVRRNILKNNPFGIHVSNAAGPVTLYNNTVDGSASLGIYAEQSPFAFTSRDNIVVNGGYGWAWDGNGSISSDYDDVYNNLSNYNYTFPVVPGAHSISANPSFVQTTDPTASDYYQLNAGSPCIGAGIDVGYGTNMGAVP